MFSERVAVCNRLPEESTDLGSLARYSIIVRDFKAHLNVFIYVFLFLFCISLHRVHCCIFLIACFSYCIVHLPGVSVSDVNKDWTHKDQDKDKDQSHEDKDRTHKDKDKDLKLVLRSP